jgi:hypothetical protein
MLLVASAFGHCDYLVEGSRNDALESVHILRYFLLFLLQFSRLLNLLFLYACFAFQILFAAHYAVGFSAAGLSVGKNGTVVPIEDVFDDGKGALLV